MMNEGEAGGFRVRCRDCGRTVLSGVAHVGDAETAELRAHVGACRPDLELADGDRTDLGTLLARFAVQRSRPGV